MTATLNGVAKKKAGEQSAEQEAAVELVRMARQQGLSLTGPDGLLKQLTRTELAEHAVRALDADATDPNIRRTLNSRCVVATRTTLTVTALS